MGLTWTERVKFRNKVKKCLQKFSIISKERIVFSASIIELTHCEPIEDFKRGGMFSLDNLQESTAKDISPYQNYRDFP